MDGELSRDQKRSRRKRNIRAKSIAPPRYKSKNPLKITEVHLEIIHEPLPKTRGDCKNQSRPCPYVSCKYHMYLDVSAKTGAIKLNFPDVEVWEMEHSCVLDIADEGSHDLEFVADVMNVTRERVRQITIESLSKIDEELEITD